MQDEPSLIRQLLLLRALSSRRFGMSVSEMAREMGVAGKTIRRDLKRFQKIGVPLLETDGERGKKTWRLVEHGRLPSLTLTYDEAVVLVLGRRLLEPMVGTQFWQAAHGAIRKIRATLGEQALQYLDQFPRLFHWTSAGVADYADKAEIIDDLTIAIEDSKSVCITYQSQRATEPATRDVHPYVFTWHNGSLYLIAFAPDHDQVRHYKVNRIEAVEIGSFQFQKPRNFDVEAHLAGAFGIYEGDEDVTVMIKFLPAAARYILESRWHASQVLTRQRDGSLLARFQLSSTVEIKGWVLSFGGNAVVLEPESLRTEIAAELAQLLKTYQLQVTTNN